MYAQKERAGLAQKATYPRKLGQGIPEHFVLQFSPGGKSLHGQVSSQHKQVNWKSGRGKKKLPIYLLTPYSFTHKVPQGTLCYHNIF